MRGFNGAASEDGEENHHYSAPLCHYRREYGFYRTRTRHDKAIRPDRGSLRRLWRQSRGPKAREIKAEIENTKPLMLTLKLTGIATILTGITIALLGILRMLSLMPIGLGDVLRANMEDMGLGKEK